MKKISVLALSTFFLISCKKEVKLTFSEINSIHNETAIVEINIPQADEKNSQSQIINTVIETHITNSLNFNEDNSEDISLDEALVNFQKEFDAFKTDFEESELVWEAIFDGEVIYQSEEVISIALNSYLNTGGAHGNMNITLFNFDPHTGNLLEIDNIISDKEGFTKLTKMHFEKETELINESEYVDFFFGEDFHLPENIGFNDDGLLILFNVYEIASYAQGIIEFTIPFDEVSKYLLVN